VTAGRIRLGIICPAPATAPEPELSSALPEGVSLCATRVSLSSVTPDDLAFAADQALEAARLLAPARVSAIGFLCTAASVVKGSAFDRRLAADITKCTGIPAVTTAGAVVAACHHLGIRRLVVATPYSLAVNRLEAAFLEENGLTVETIRGMDLTDPDHIRAITPEDMQRFCCGLWRKQADGLFFSCTGVETFPVLRALEEEIERPVVSSNQASLWAMLRSAGIRARVLGRGCLLDGSRDTDQNL
jgi:maleate isomerase